MSTLAVIIAGGAGARMGQDIPKQFINVYDKPVLIYTLEGFQKHPNGLSPEDIPGRSLSATGCSTWRENAWTMISS